MRSSARRGCSRWNSRSAYSRAGWVEPIVRSGRIEHLQNGVSNLPRPSSMKDTSTSVRAKPAKSKVPTDPALGIMIVPRSNAPWVTDIPCCENPPAVDAVVTDMGSPLAAAGTSAANTNTTQAALIRAPFSLEYHFSKFAAVKCRRSSHTPGIRARPAATVQRGFQSAKPNNLGGKSRFQRSRGLW